MPVTTSKFFPPFRGITSNRKGTVLSQIDSDQSGTKEYRLGAHGFRGPDFVRRDRNIFVFGCSHTFGTGLNEDEIWPHFLHRHYCRITHLEPRDVGLANFGLGGASNHEIADLALMQCSAIKPDLAVVQFTYCERSQMVFGDEMFAFGPWVPALPGFSDEQCAAATAYYHSYRDEHGGFELVREMLHVQHYFRSRGIDYIFFAIADPAKLSVPTVRFLRMLDRCRVMWLPRLLRRKLDPTHLATALQEKAADGGHYSRTIHEIVASLVAERWRNVQERRKAEGANDQLRRDEAVGRDGAGP